MAAMKEKDRKVAMSVDSRDTYLAVSMACLMGDLLVAKWEPLSVGMRVSSWVSSMAEKMES
jgi:hypothetical protein